MLNTILHHVYGLFNPKVFENEAASYYAGSHNSQSLRKIFALMNKTGESNFFSPIPITFRGVAPLTELKLVTKQLGKPLAESSKRYLKKTLKTLTYNHEIDGIETDTIINFLDNKAISFTYHINTLSKGAAIKIKQHICNRYGINDASTVSSFCLIDEFNNKLLFTFEFDLVIHYVTADEEMLDQVAKILNEVEIHKQYITRSHQNQTELAF